jgi:HEAT repeat protein
MKKKRAAEAKSLQREVRRRERLASLRRAASLGAAGALWLAAAGALAQEGEPGAMPRPNPSELILMLDESDYFARREAVDQLRDLGPEAEAAFAKLLERLRDPNEFPDLRAAAASALAAIDPEAARPPLAEALSADDPMVRQRAIEELGDLGASATPDLLKILEGEDEELRRNAVQALAAAGREAESASAALAKLVADPSEPGNLRAGAAAALGAIGPSASGEAMPTLIRALRDPKEHWSVQSAAAGALAGIRAEPSEALPPLLEALKNSAEPVRESAAGALATLAPRDQRVIVALTEALNDKNAGVRARAATGLGRAGEAASGATDRLIELLQTDSDWSVRYRAAEALGEIGHPKAAPVLKATSDNLRESFSVSAAARDALAKMEKSNLK